ncbi:MAG: amidohydrolase family protein [Burkholderiales bacterium]
MTSQRSAAQIRAKLTHPILDADGHWLEFPPAMRDRMHRVGGERAAAGFAASQRRFGASLTASVEERRKNRVPQEAFWPFPNDPTDRATVMMPKLFYQRLDELGIDFAVIYPTAGLPIVRIMDPELRRAACRAYNVIVAEQFGPYADRMCPAALIPMYTPDEAIEEIEYVTRQLGLKVAMLGSLARRLLPSVVQYPDGGRAAEWYDPIGLDSQYDYDGVWQACAAFGISPTFHTGARWQGFRTSPTNFTYNHIGHFAVAAEAVCKALFLGGVTRRFPNLNFAFLEGGVGWASILLGDLLGHWEKRNGQGLRLTEPGRMDGSLMLRLAEAHASGELLQKIREMNGRIDSDAESRATGGIADLDDFSACKIERPEDFLQLFAGSFYFGCEADDHANAWAFNRKVNPLGARLNAMFGSDIGHFDVPDIKQVVPEAYELLEHGLLNDEEFRAFTFENAVRFWGTHNPAFFKGTVIERAAADVLATKGAVVRQP